MIAVKDDHTETALKARKSFNWKPQFHLADGGYYVFQPGLSAFSIPFTRKGKPGHQKSQKNQSQLLSLVKSQSKPHID